MNVSAYLYADEHSFLNMSKLREFHQSQMWMSDEVIVHKPYLLDLCRNNVLQCKTINKHIVAELGDKLSKLDAGMKLKTKLKACFDAVAGGTKLKIEATALVDQVVFIPERLTRTFRLLADLLMSDVDTQQYMLIIPLILECTEVTPEALTVSSMYDGTGHYYFPVPVDQIAAKHLASTKQFCQATRAT